MADRFEADVREWLAHDAPAEAPDRILDVVLARIDVIPLNGSRWGWARIWAPAAVAVLAVAAMLGIARLLNVGAPAEPIPSLPGRPASIECPTSPCSFPLEPGAYRTASFAVSMTFEVADAKWAATYDNPGFVRIERVSDPRQRVTVMADVEPLESQGYPAPTASDPQSLVTWFVNHPDLVVSAPQEVTMGGLSGTRIDVTGVFAAQVSGEGCIETAGCVTLLGTNGVPFGVSSFDHVRLYLLRRGSADTLVVAVEARHETPTDEFQPAADALLASLKFGD